MLDLDSKSAPKASAPTEAASDADGAFETKLLGALQKVETEMYSTDSLVPSTSPSLSDQSTEQQLISALQNLSVSHEARPKEPTQ